MMGDRAELLEVEVSQGKSVLHEVAEIRVAFAIDFVKVLVCMLADPG
jgi:hypothetical protein